LGFLLKKTGIQQAIFLTSSEFAENRQTPKEAEVKKKTRRRAQKPLITVKKRAKT